MIFLKMPFLASINENSFVINDDHKNIQDSTKKLPSILVIKNKIRCTDTSRFETVTLSDIQFPEETTANIFFLIMLYLTASLQKFETDERHTSFQEKL